MPNRDTPYRFPTSQRNQFVMVEQRSFGKDFAGAPFAIYEETIPQGSAPDVGTFGVFEPYVYNERNHTQSRHRFVQIDVNAAAITFRYRTADDGSLIRETREVVPTGTALPDGSLNLLNATRARMDQNHEMLVTETMESFPLLVDVEQASERFGGLDILRKRQRAGPTYGTSPTLTQSIASVPIVMNDGLVITIGTLVGVISREVNVSLGVPAQGSNYLVTNTTNQAAFWDEVCAFAILKLGQYGVTMTRNGTNVTLSSNKIGTDKQVRLIAALPFVSPPYTIFFDVSNYGTFNSGPSGLDGFSSEAETAERAMRSEIDIVTPAGNEQITLRDWVPSLQAAQVMKKVEVVGTNDNPNATYLDVAIQDKKIAVGTKLRTRFYVAAWQDFVDYEIEPETNEAVTITRRIRDKASFVYTKEPRVEIEAKQMDNLRVLETRKTLNDAVLGKSYKTTRNIQYKFPGWLAPGDEYYLQQLYLGGSAATTAKTISGFNEKPGQVLTVPADVITTYHPNRPLAPEVFQFYTSSFSAQVGFNYEFMTDDFKARLGQRSLNYNSLITNSAPCIWRCVEISSGFTISIMTRDDPQWAGVYFTRALEKSIPESVPNASVYVSMMLSGYRVLVGVEIEQWKYNLWKQTRTYIKIPNLITPGLAGL